MSKPIYRFIRSIAVCLLILSFSIVFISCKDDEKKIDCDAIEEQLEDLLDDLDDAIEDGDCDKVEDIYDDIIKLLEKGEDCEFVEDFIDDTGADDIDELIELLEGYSDDCTNLDCDASESRFYELVDDLGNAFLNEDCSEIETLYIEIISLLREAENCEFAADVANDEGFDSVDELVDYIEDDLDSILIDLGC